MPCAGNGLRRLGNPWPISCCPRTAFLSLRQLARDAAGVHDRRGSHGRLSAWTSLKNGKTNRLKGRFQKSLSFQGRERETGGYLGIADEVHSGRAIPPAGHGRPAGRGFRPGSATSKKKRKMSYGRSTGYSFDS